MNWKARYSYFVEIENGKHKCVSAKEFKELSKTWEPQPEENSITIFKEGTKERGRRVRIY